MTVALPGVYSGIDSETLIAQLMAINRRPLALLQNRKTLYEGREVAVGDLESRLGQLKDLAASLRGTSKLRRVIPSSSDTDVVTASAAEGAGEGVHDVVVNQLAKGHRLVQTAGLADVEDVVGQAGALNSNWVADADATWFSTTSNNTFYTFDFGAEPDITDVEFTKNSDYSMNEAAAEINIRSQAVAGYDAAVVEYDSDAGRYYLRVSAELSTTSGTMTQTLTAGDAIAEIHDEADWSKTTAGEGKFAYTYDGTTRSVVAAAGTTLEELRDLINNDAQNPGVTASLLEYGSTYHLVLAGSDTGTDYAITIDDFNTTLNDFDTADFTESQAARNAELRVDGYPAGPNWLERSSNTVTDVLPNVTLTLKATGSASVSLTRETATLDQDLSNLASIYNGLVDKIDQYAGYDEENETRGLMQGDSVVTGLLSGIRMDLVAPAAGFLEGASADTFTLPAHIGLKIDNEGHVELNATDFSDALAEDYLGLLALVADRNTGASDSDYIKFETAQDTTTPGTYEVEVDFDGGGTITAARIRTQGESSWRALAVVGGELLGVGGTAEEDLVLSAVWDGVSGTQTADVRVKEGFASAIYEKADDLLDAIDGRLQLKKDQLDSAIEQIDRDIERRLERLESQETRLRQRFAKLEALLAIYDRQLSAVQQLSNQVTAFANFLSNRG